MYDVSPITLIIYNKPSLLQITITIAKLYCCYSYIMEIIQQKILLSEQAISNILYLLSGTFYINVHVHLTYYD